MMISASPDFLKRTDIPTWSYSSSSQTYYSQGLPLLRDGTTSGCSVWMTSECHPYHLSFFYIPCPIFQKIILVLCSNCVQPYHFSPPALRLSARPTSSFALIIVVAPWLALCFHICCPFSSYKVGRVILAAAELEHATALIKAVMAPHCRPEGKNLCDLSLPPCYLSELISSDFYSSLSALQPHWPPCCSSRMPGMLLPQVELWLLLSLCHLSTLQFLNVYVMDSLYATAPSQEGMLTIFKITTVFLANSILLTLL